MKSMFRAAKNELETASVVDVIGKFLSKKKYGEYKGSNNCKAGNDYLF